MPLAMLPRVSLAMLRHAAPCCAMLPMPRVSLSMLRHAASANAPIIDFAISIIAIAFVAAVVAVESIVAID